MNKFCATLILYVLMVIPSHATVINFTTGNYVAYDSTIYMSGVSKSIDLIPEAHKISSINDFTFYSTHNNDVPYFDSYSNYAVSRSISVDGLTQNIVQYGVIRHSYDYDSLNIYSSEILSFNLGLSGILDVTPLSISSPRVSNRSPYAQESFHSNIYADFYLHNIPPQPSVPEPSTFLLVGAGIVGVSIWSRKK